MLASRSSTSCDCSGVKPSPLSGVLSPGFDSWFEFRMEPSSVEGDKVIAAAIAAPHPKSRREIGERRVARRFSTTGEFGGEEACDTGPIVLYIISARQHKSRALRTEISAERGNPCPVPSF